MRKPSSNRDKAQRIASIEQRFLQHNFFPPAFTHAITTYLMGEAALADVKQALHEAIRIGGAGIYLDFPLFGLEGMSAGPDAPLDALDLRILDLFILAGHVDVFLINNRERDTMAQVHQRLQGRGMSEQAILKLFCLAAPYAAFDTDHKIMPLGRYLLPFVPEKLDGLPRGRQYDYSFPYDIRLFLAKQPPALDLAWQEVQYMADDDSDYYNHSFGLCVSLLLQADAARFTPWARQIARPKSQVNEIKRQGALQALLKAQDDEKASRQSDAADSSSASA